MRLAKRSLAAAVLFFACVATAASAKLERWTLTNVRFASATNTATGEVLPGGFVWGFYVVDSSAPQQLVTWNIFTSPGWAKCNNPSVGNVCYTDGLHWTRNNSQVFPYAAFFQLLRGDQNTYPLLNIFVHPTPDPNLMSLDLHNSIEILTDAPTTYRQIVTGTANRKARRAGHEDDDD